MPQNPGDIPLPTEDVPMFNPPNGQFAIPASVQAQPTPLTETGFGDAVLQELMQSRRSQEQLMERLVTAITTARPGEGGGKKLAADPQPYDGSPGKLDEFLSDLRLCFLADRKRFDTERSKILYALSYMKEGSAHAWTVNETKKEDVGGYANWEEFEKTLRGRFQMGNKKVEAQNFLRKLYQKGRMVEEYFDEFEAYHPYSGYNDDALIGILREHLDLNLLNAMYTQNEMPTTYLGWKKLAICKDRQLWEARDITADRYRERGDRFPRGRGGSGGGNYSAGEHGHVGGSGGGGHAGGGGGGHGAGAGGGHGTGGGGRGGTTAERPGGGGNSTPGITSGMGTPMDIDRRQGGIGKCFNCGEIGHLHRNCPYPRGSHSRSSIRAMISGFNNNERGMIREELEDFTNGGEEN